MAADSDPKRLFRGWGKRQVQTDCVREALRLKNGGCFETARPEFWRAVRGLPSAIDENVRPGEHLVDNGRCDAALPPDEIVERAEQPLPSVDRLPVDLALAEAMALDHAALTERDRRSWVKLLHDAGCSGASIARVLCVDDSMVRRDLTFMSTAKPLDGGYVSRKFRHDAHVREWKAIQKRDATEARRAVAREKKKEYNREWDKERYVALKADPVMWAQHCERKARQMRERRARNAKPRLKCVSLTPEERARRRREQYQALKSDPVRYAEFQRKLSEKKRKEYQALKADPVRYAEYLQKHAETKRASIARKRQAKQAAREQPAPLEA